MLSLEGERKAQPLIRTSFNEGAATLSPDGHWLAYVSNESGRNEVYVQPFPGPGGKVPISTEGGEQPRWARNGKELFYRNGDRMMAVVIQTQPTFSAAKPDMLFEGNYWKWSTAPNYDITPDGQRFVMIKESQPVAAITHVSVVLNWFEELKQRVPTNQ